MIVTVGIELGKAEGGGSCVGDADCSKVGTMLGALLGILVDGLLLGLFVVGLLLGVLVDGLLLGLLVVGLLLGLLVDGLIDGDMVGVPEGMGVISGY